MIIAELSFNLELKLLLFLGFFKQNQIQTSKFISRFTFIHSNYKQNYVELAWNFIGYRYKNNLSLWDHAATFVSEMKFVNVLSVITSCWLQWEMELLSALKVLNFCCSAMLLKLSTQLKISAKVIKFLTSIFVEFTFECKEVCCSLLWHNFLV